MIQLRLLTVAIVIVAGVAAAPFVAAIAMQQAESGTSNVALISGVIQLVQRAYVHPVDSDTLTKDALKGMLNRLDPHSDYMDEQEYKQSQADIAGRFGGLGIQISEQDGIPKVISPDWAMQDHWQLVGTAPELYERYLVPAITSKWAEDLVDRAEPNAGDKVLDIACGTGIVARTASRRMRRGQVTGLDLNQGMLAVARTSSIEGAPVAWMEGSALDLPFEDASFDVVLCQLGVQFFPDQGRALREMRRVVTPAGRVVVSVYSPIERTPGAHAFVQALDRVLGPEASRTKRGEHSFNAPEELGGLLSGAGFADVEVQVVVQHIAFPSVLDYVSFQLLATPMAALLKDRDLAGREQAIEAVAAEITALAGLGMVDGGRFAFPQEAYVAVAKACGEAVR